MAASGAVPHVPRPAGAPDVHITAATFDAEIRRAVRIERWLAVKALLALALVAAALAAHVIFFS